MAALQALAGTGGGVLVLAGSGLMPARLLLVPAGTRLPRGVAGVPATAVVASVGSGSRAMRLVARAAAGADHGVPSGVLASLAIGDATNAGGALASLSLDGATNAVVLLASLPLDDATDAGVLLAPLSLDDAANAGVLASLSLGATGAAARGPLRFLGGDVASAGFGISSAALANAAGRRVSRGGGLVVAATAGSEADGGDDNGSADSTKLDLFLEKKNAVLTSWDSVDVVRDYRAEPFVGDVRELQEKANKGMILLRVLLDAGLDYSNADLWVVSYAGVCVRRLCLQCQRGFVYDAAVVEATRAIELVCHRLLPELATGSTADPGVAFPKERAQAFVTVIDALEVAVTTA